MAVGASLALQRVKNADAPPNSVFPVEDGVARSQKHNRPRKRSNECARDVDARSRSRRKVIECPSCDRGADNTKCEIQHDVLAFTLEDPEGYVTGRESEKNENNN
jgi:hypothetical protein